MSEGLPIANYGSGSESDEDKEEEEKAQWNKKKLMVSKIKKCKPVAAAPLVALDLKSSQVALHESHKNTELFHNPTAVELWQPVAGPHNPYADTTIGQEQGIVQNAVTGFVEKTHFDNYHFEEQYNTFMRHGYSADPTDAEEGSKGTRLVGDKDEILKTGGKTVGEQPLVARTDEQKESRKKRKGMSSDVTDVDNFKGPWATYYYEDEEVAAEITEEQKEFAAEFEKKKKKKKDEDDTGPIMEESSEFHGKELYDYQGRSYLHPPSGLKPVTGQKCFIPKKQVHTWSGHTKGVSRIQFFPTYGHLLLSASMDSTIKLWDVYNERKCLRTIYGHTEAVRDIDFNHDGSKFISVSYDRYVKLWDTETGNLISKHVNGGYRSSAILPFCGKIYPYDDNQMLVGQGDKKVIQWDMRSNEVTQVYDEHLGPVNSICIMDEGRRFISTSDDKKIYMWEYGIPVVIKHIAEPDMHSIPFTALTPDGKWFVGQSQDNQIVTYGAVAKVKLNSKKRFRGHLTAGYACEVGFSPCQKYIYSGDSEGRVFFWDWRTGRLYKKLKAHDQVCIGAAWHPIETSKFATCSWDGLIKYWD